MGIDFCNRLNELCLHLWINHLTRRRHILELFQWWTSGQSIELCVNRSATNVLSNQYYKTTPIIYLNWKSTSDFSRICLLLHPTHTDDSNSKTSLSVTWRKRKKSQVNFITTERTVLFERKFLRESTRLAVKFVVIDVEI